MYSTYILELYSFHIYWRPPWAAYHALMSGQLIALDKQPGISLVGVGETWRRLMAKCLLKVRGPEAKSACGTTQIAGGP